MGILLEVYNDLVKKAEKAEVHAMLQQRVEFLNKYATLATELLSAEFPNDYSKDDVVELADKLIERDLAITEAQEKVAEAQAVLGEYVKVSRELLEKENGKNFTDSTVEKLAATLFEMDAEEELNKEAETVVEAGFVSEFNTLANTTFSSIDEIDESLKTASFYSEIAPSLANAKTSILGAGKKLMATAKGKMSANPTMGAAAVGGAGLLAGVGVGRATKRSGGDN